MSSLASLYGPNVKCVRRIRKEGRGDVCGVRGPNNPSGGRLRPLLQVLVRITKSDIWSEYQRVWVIGDDWMIVIRASVFALAVLL